MDFIDENVKVEDCVVYTNDGYGFMGLCMGIYFPEIETVPYEEWRAEEENDTNNVEGNTWLFIGSESSDSIKIGQMEVFGEYDFGSVKFRVFQVSE